jgi:hypothetical protein
LLQQSLVDLQHAITSPALDSLIDQTENHVRSRQISFLWFSFSSAWQAHTVSMQDAWIEILMEAVRFAPEHNPASDALVAYLAEQPGLPVLSTVLRLRDAIMAQLESPQCTSGITRNSLVALGVLASDFSGASKNTHTHTQKKFRK